MRYIRIILKTLVSYIFWVFVIALILSFIFNIFWKNFFSTIYNAPDILLFAGLTIYFLFILIAAFIITRFFFLRKYKPKEREDLSEDESGLNFKTTETEMTIPFNLINYHFSLLAIPSDILIPNPFRSIFVTGTAGSGKTASLAHSFLQQAVNKKYSILLYDFKSPSLTNYLESAKDHFKSDFKHFFVNFNDINTTYRVNPLNPKFLPNATYAREYASAIIFNLLPESMQKIDYWIRSSTDLLTACIWYLREEHPDKCTLPHVCNLILNNDKRLLELLQTNSQAADLTISIYNAMERKADAQLAGVVGTLQSAISRINTPEINYILSGNDFDLDINDPENPKFVSIGSNPDLVDTFSPVISLIFTVAFKQMNKPNKQHSFVLIDEAPTLFIPKLESLPATARENKVSLCYMCQDISQMVDMLGIHKTESIISNLNNQFFGRTTNPKSAEHISRLFGKEDKTFITKSASQSENTGISGSILKSSESEGQGYSLSHNQSIQERSIIKPQHVLGLETGEFYCTIADYKTKQLKWKLKLPEEINYKQANRFNLNSNPILVQQRIKQDIQEIFKIKNL
jgi:hypothetical protein